MILNANLSASQIESLLRVLRMHHKAIGNTLNDLKRIFSSVCMHHILIKNNHKLSIEHRRRLNSNMKEVVKKDILRC